MKPSQSLNPSVSKSTQKTLEKKHMHRRTFMSRLSAAVFGGSIAAGSVPAAVANAVERYQTFQPGNTPEINMQYRRLGKTGIRLSEISLGGHNYELEKKYNYYRKTIIIDEAVDDLEQYAEYYKERTEQIALALDVGINFIDCENDREVRSTAVALQRLGKRNDCYLTGDFLRGRYNDEKTPEDMRYSLIEHINKTIRVLKTDRIDLQSCATFDKWSMEEVAGAIDGFQYLRKEGKARFFGVSGHDPEYIKKVILTFPGEIDFIRFPYSFALRRGEKELFPLADKHGIGVITIKPFHGGSFFKPGIKTKKEQTTSPPQELLKTLPREKTETLAQANLRYILSNPHVSTIIPGVNSCREIMENVTAVSPNQIGLLDADELENYAQVLLEALPPEYQWLNKWRA